MSVSTAQIINALPCHLSEEVKIAIFRLLARIVELGPREHVVTVSALAEDEDRTEVRMASEPSAREARERKDYLVMSLATELRAQGHEIVGLVE